MARYTDSVCRMCRREGTKLFLKGEKCYGAKCPVDLRHTVPGEHGQARQRKMSEYGLQLRAKQMTRRYYGVLESQFRKYYEMAEKKEGKTGEALLAILESRLDNTVYRLGWASSHAEARQLVNHGHFTVNGKKVDIPSYLTKPGDVIAIAEGSRSNGKFKVVIEACAARPVPKYLEAKPEAFEGKVVAFAQRDEIDLDVDETLIVELYSK